MATRPNLLFIDTNIWLDFYRARNETGLRLLEKTEAISDRLIVTYQLETEFKKNRHDAMLEGMSVLKPPQQISRPGIFSDAKATRILEKNLKEAEKSVNILRRRLIKALENPATHDPVYKVCQRVFHKSDDITLHRDSDLRHIIRRQAFRRFLHGAPPRKKNDTSIGDAFNWEWMVHCSTQKKAGLVIVTRDSDYGVTVDGKSYVNDHLRQEFSERVSQKRKLTMSSRLSEALKLFAVDVSPKEEEAEKELASSVAAYRDVWSAETLPYFEAARRSFNEALLRAGQPDVLSQYTRLKDLANLYKRPASEVVEPIKVEGETTKERTSKELADTKDEGQPGGSTHNPKT